jgi:threonine synthase
VTTAAVANVRALVCTGCRAEHPPGVRYHCDACGFPLAVAYGPDQPPPSADASQPGIWRWHRSLPEVAPANRVSLGEGATPSLDAPALASALGVGALTLKAEGGNPTGSFKDRPTALGTGLALELGADTVIVSSTGNAGASLAAYAARAGLRAVVLANASASPAKLAPIALHGAEIILVEGTVSDAFALAHEAAQTWRWTNLTSTFVNPYPVEANKTVAYELYDRHGTVPDVVLIPVSVGPLLVGMHRGYAELRAAGVIDRVPRMVAVQAAGCAPIVRAFDADDERVEAWPGPVDTVAGGIADPLIGYADDATWTLQAVRESGGFAIACADEEILDAQRGLARSEGVFAEPTGAVGVAGLAKAIARGWVGADDHVVCIVTAHGFKQPPSGEGVAPRATIRPDLAELERALAATGAGAR